ncbi:hypothetical protein FS749_004020 [Ceratobasidium sp. UAMH 11750]|nr:hypothetical protein FS749_004020 [Ceratobasidium sp. UAMH 11750]
MTDAWANSADTTPANLAEPKGNDGWGPSTNGRAERDPYKDQSTAPPDRDVRRSRSRSPAREGSRGNTNPGTNLHVSGLHPRVTDRMLEDTFSKYGKIEKAQVVYDPHTRDSRGFAFVMMSTLEEAEAAISGLNGYVLEGMALRVDKARRGRARTPTPGQFRGPPRRNYERPYTPREHDYRYRGRYEDDGYYGRDRGYYGRDRDRYRDYDRDDYDRYDDRYSRSRYEDDRRYSSRYSDGGWDRGRYDARR